MKTGRSRLYLARNCRRRGFTLIEVMVAMAIGLVILTVVLHLLGTFFGGAQIVQGMLIDARYRVEEIGYDLERESLKPGKGFHFIGQLSRADGSLYTGGPVNLAKAMADISDEADFLSSAGLTQTITADTDQETFIWLVDAEDPVWLYRESHELTDGSGALVVSVSYSGNRISRRASFNANINNPAAKLAAARGSISTDEEGRGLVTLPNPLALAAVNMPETNEGMEIAFQSLRYRLKP